MANNSFKVKNSLNIEPKTSPTLNAEGDIAWNSTSHKLEIRDNSGTKSVVSEDGSATLTNKTISGSSNTLTNIPLSAATGTLPVANGGTNSTTALNNNRVIVSSGSAIVEAAAITASRALASDANGIPVASATTATELGYVNGVTSAIQTQIDAKVAKATLTTKGDVYVATGSATVVRQEIGSDGQVLTADSAQTNGLKWAAPTGSPTTTKGDLAGYDTASARVPVGTNGYVLTADSTQALGLKWAALPVPTIQRFTSGSGTYTTPSGVRYIRVRMAGGGGGGSGSGTSSGTAAGDGVDSTFGNLTAGKGLAGVWNAGGSAGGAVTVGAGWSNVASTVGGGSAGFMQVASGGNLSPGGLGGTNVFGGAPAAGAYSSVGTAGTANTGSGGQGGGGNNTAGADAGTGGSAGAYIEAITSGAPSGTYSYAVGSGGSAGGAGGSGLAGGAGGSGIIIVEEYY